MDLGDISSIIYDGYRLVAMFFDAINSCPEQIYTSGLSFSPECALVKLYAKDRRSNCLVSPRDVVWGPCVHVLKHTYGREITLSDDGRLLALAGPFGVEIRDAATLDLRKNFEYAEETTSANFHPSNHSFVFLSRNGTVEERSLIANTHRRYRCELPEEDIKDDTWISSVAYSSDGTRIVCYWGGVDAILVWSNKDCSQSPMKIPTPAMTFKTFSFISDGMHIDALFSATDNLPVLKRWNVDSGEEVNSLEISSEEITTAVFSKNNTVLITGYINKICVWSLDGNCITQLNTITGNWGDITAIDVTQSGDIIASGGVDTVIRLWDASSLAPLAFYPGHTRSIKSLRFSPQGDRLVSISFDNSTRVWHTKKEDLHLTSSNNSRILKNAVFSPNGEYIATSAGSDILVWDGKKGTYLTTFTGHSEVIRSLGFSKDGSLLASVSSVDGVFLWDVRKKGTVPRTLPDSNRIGSHTLFSIAANTTGDQLAVIYGDDCIENNRPEYSFWVGTWDLSTYKGEESSEVGIKMLQSKHIIGFRPHFVRFSPREALVLVRYFELKYESKVVIWDCPSDTMEAHDYDEDRHSASKPDFSIEENWIVSNRTGRQMLWLPESRKPFYRVFTARGNLVAIGSETGELSLLDMSPFMNLR
jgi:WD40 repeat protein